MKIWCQSAGALGKDKAWKPYEQSLRRHLQDVVRPGTEVHLQGTDFTIPGLARYRTPSLVAQFQAIRNAISAEEQGYDAFVQNSTNDGGFDEIRELVNIPAIFVTETGLHLACLLADKFAFFTHNKLMLERITELAERYGMTHRMVPGGHLNLSGYSDLMEMYQHPKRHVDSVVRVVREISARGAHVLFPAAGALNQWLVDNKLQEIDDTLILDASGAAVKMAELMVDLKGIGIQRSRGYHPRPQPDVLEALKKVVLDASFTPKS